MSDFGTFAYGVIGGAVSAVALTILWYAQREQRELAIVRESRDFYRGLYVAKCVDEDRANAARFAAERAAAVEAADAIVKGAA